MAQLTIDRARFEAAHPVAQRRVPRVLRAVHYRHGSTEPRLLTTEAVAQKSPVRAETSRYAPSHAATPRRKREAHHRRKTAPMPTPDTSQLGAAGQLNLSEGT